MVLEVILVILEVVLVVLEVVLVVLEVTRPQVPWGVYQIRLSLRPGLYSPALPITICCCCCCIHIHGEGKDLIRTLEGPYKLLIRAL